MNRFLIAALLLPTIALAETHYITVPGEGWSLKLELPPVANAKSQTEGRRFQYLGNTRSGVTLSLYAELDGAQSHEACRETFWAKSLNNPNLVKDSAKLFATESAAFATHLSEGSYQGKPFKTANGHAYFVNMGLCMDLHVSHYPYGEGSEKQVEDILRSAAIVQ